MNELEWGFVFSPEVCIQCHACVSACKSWREVEPGVSWRTVIKRWEGTYPQVKSVPVSLSCMHCADPECVRVCPVGAIRKQDPEGLVLIDRDVCIGCRLCAKACPFHIPKFGENGKMQKCDFCYANLSDTEVGEAATPPCVKTCPTHALRLKQMTPAEKAEQEKALTDLLSK